MEWNQLNRPYLEPESRKYLSHDELTEAIQVLRSRKHSNSSPFLSLPLNANSTNTAPPSSSPHEITEKPSSLSSLEDNSHKNITCSLNEAFTSY